MTEFFACLVAAGIVFGCVAVVIDYLMDQD